MSFKLPIHEFRDLLRLSNTLVSLIQLHVSLLVQLIMIRIVQVFQELSLEMSNEVAVPAENSVHLIDALLRFCLQTSGRINLNRESKVSEMQNTKVHATHRNSVILLRVVQERQ